MGGVERRAKRAAGWLFETNPVQNRLAGRSVDRPAVQDGGCPGVEAVHRFGHEAVVSFAHLRSVPQTPSILGERPETVETPPWTVVECSDVQLVGPEGLTLLPDGRVLIENSLGWTKRVGVSGIRSLVDRTLPIRRDGAAEQSFNTVVSLVGPWTHNYYHWHLDYLARLAALSAFTEMTGRRPPLLLPPGTSGWMTEALSLVGYESDDWIVWDGRRTDVNRLIVPTLPRATEGSAPKLLNHYYSLNPAAVRWLGDQIRANVGEDTISHAPESGRLYVSRQGGDSRRVDNLDGLEAILMEYGFERFRPEEYGIDEQVSTFDDADVVLGVHGAGLTNLLFARDATLLELFGEYVNPVFYALAVQTGNDYACAGFESRGTNLRVGSARLRRLFDLAGLSPVK